MIFEGKTAVVVGGGRDIGRACALKLARGGASLVINYHASEQGARSAVTEIEAGGGRAVAVQADVTQGPEVERLVDETAKAFGDTIDVLVHVTGGLVARKTLAEMDLEHWQAVHAVNLTSLFLTTKAVVPRMPEGGSIVAFSSQAGRDGGGPGASAYASAKAAVMGYTRALAKELGPRIRVNALCPGMIDTDFHNVFTQPGVRKRVAEASLVKREGTPEEVADLTAFLASREAAFITGACLDINGGMLFS
jgi:3-oxoacyl-[acyl-carrier protein] reductase